MKVFYYFKVLFTLIREFRTQEKFNKEYLFPKIKSLESECNGFFTSEQLFKIKKYYGLYIPAIISSQIKYIYSQKLTEIERKRASLFGILTPLYDDIFDLESLSEENYRQITLDPNEHQASSFQTRVVKTLQKEIIKLAKNPEDYINACKRVLECQLNSKLQANNNLNLDQLEKITYDKGGYSMILYHHLVDHNMTPSMYELLYCIGCNYQLSNDVFDIYKDVRDGIYTIPNTCNDFSTLKRTIYQLISMQNTKLRQLGLPAIQTNRLLFSLNLVNARTIVALNYFIKSFPSISSEPFEYWKSKNRSELIIDMEKPINAIKWIWNTYKCAEY